MPDTTPSHVTAFLALTARDCGLPMAAPPAHQPPPAARVLELLTAWIEAEAESAAAEYQEGPDAGMARFRAAGAALRAKDALIEAHRQFRGRA